MKADDETIRNGCFCFVEAKLRYLCSDLEDSLMLPSPNKKEDLKLWRSCRTLGFDGPVGQPAAYLSRSSSWQDLDLARQAAK